MTKQNNSTNMGDYLDKKYNSGAYVTAPTHNTSSEDGLRGRIVELLADNEHRTWASWQEYAHQVFRDGNYQTFMPRWEQQIKANYSELPEEDKDKDRREVQATADQILEIIQSEKDKLLAELLENSRNYVLDKDNPDIGGHLHISAVPKQVIQSMMNRKDKDGE